MKIRIHSGGQTGADIAGLWVAKTMGLPTGGWAPSDFLTQKGLQPGLKEVFGLSDMGNYRQRTIQNVRESDVTLIFSRSMNSPGTVLTQNSAMKLKKQVFSMPDNRHEGESLRQYRGNFEDPRLDVWKNALGYLLQKAEKEKKIPLDEFFIINVAGNSTKRSTPEAFEFAFVGFWFMMMMFGHGLQNIGLDNFAKDFVDVDPVELASTLKDRFEEL